MEIKQLRYFVKVAELSSVGKASDFLNIAQPTLSRQIRALEIELKTNLFSRDGRGVQLTVHGRRFLEHARGILHAIPPWTLSTRVSRSTRVKSLPG